VLGYDVKSLCERCPTFRMNAVPSPVKVKNSVLSLSHQSTLWSAVIFQWVVVRLTASLQLSWSVALGTGSLPCNEQVNVWKETVLAYGGVHGSSVRMAGDSGKIAVDHFSNTRFQWYCATTHAKQLRKGYRSRRLIRKGFSCLYLKKMQTKLLSVAHYIQKVY
jgi:hypothetical protein